MTAETNPKPRASFVPALLGLVVALLGFLIFQSGLQVVMQWSAITALYALCGAIWVFGGAAMMIGGVWGVASLGRRRVPLLMGGLGSVVAGASLIIGVLTYVVPCSGPS